MKSEKVSCLFTRKSIEVDMASYEAGMASCVMEAFENYADGGIHMNALQLRRFHGDAISISDAQRILKEICRPSDRNTPFFINRKILSFEDFQNYVKPPIISQVYQDMNLPLSHYFIYASHNSNKTANQISSSYIEVPIIKALKRGVRAIKLDLWPNSFEDNVHVLHGGTPTTPVELIRCLKSIKEHAFTSSPYPVIITLEDHLTPALQGKVAQMVTDTFGEMLFCHKSDKLEELPTPESLKYRILISTKPSKEYLEAEEDKCWKSQRAKDFAYTNLVGIHAGKPKSGVVEALKVEKDDVKHLSLSEQEFEQVAEHHQQEIVRFTQKNILKLYPKGTCITSSNYKPLVGWLHGAQMIAFNMQVYDKWLWLMHGMFRANGGCGYVKKPDFLMTSGPYNEIFDSKAELPVKTILKVKIFMGDGWHLDFNKTHFDAYSPPDFYTKVGISGTHDDEIMKMTRVKEDTWTPVWDEEFEFRLRLPEIALLRIEVHENNMSKKNNFAGQTCLPVSELMPGMHMVRLCDRKGDTYTGAKLLMQFQFVS